jgi:transketolase
VIQELAAKRPDVLSGDADLAGSTKSLIDASADFSATDRLGRNIRYGVREHAMGSIVNGITLHGGMRAFGSTFLTFSDYMRGAVRLGALMGTPGIWVWSHDSIFLGEDGPTHQPIGHVASLRAIPNLWVCRPGDPTEVAGAWELAVNRTDGPTAIVLTRQGVPVPAEAPEPSLVARGAYIRREGDDAVLIATGSEVWVAEEAAELVAEEGLSLRVVSMPCWEAFDEQGEDYRASVLGGGIPIASIEAGATFGWAGYTGRSGLNIGIDAFGASAPSDVLAEEYGFTPAAVAERILDWLRR